MDSIRVNIQNQEFIEKLIESNPELGVKINNAIIDGISKRIAKNVINNCNQAINDAIIEASKEVSKQFLEVDSNHSTFLQTKYKLKDDCKQLIHDEVFNAWFEEVSKAVNEQKEKMRQRYLSMLESQCNRYVKMLEDATSRIDDEIDDKINSAVKKYFQEHFR